MGLPAFPRLNLPIALYALARRIQSMKPKPQSLIATIGDVLVRIDGPKLWTLSRIEWRGTLMAVEDSCYGTTIMVPDIGPIGSGHHEIESENVVELNFFIDDQPLRSMAATMNLRGARFRVSRKSTIRSLKLDSILEVHSDVIVQAVHITNERPIELNALYPLMYAWTPRASVYLFGCDNGQEVEGRFLTEPQDKAQYTFQRGARWAAVYDADAGIGSVSYVLAEADSGDRLFLLSDAPEIYRKLYLKCFTDSVLPARFDGNYRIILGFFSVAKQDNWKVRARERARELSEFESRFIDERQGALK